MTKNLHVPLPEDLNDELRAEAARSGRPATEIAREAIKRFLRQRRRQALHDEISAYARSVSGTDADLDPALESAAVEELMSVDET